MRHVTTVNVLKRARKGGRVTCDMRAKSMGCRLWQQRARRGPALGLRHCRQSRVNQKRSITAFTPPHLLKSSTNVGYCRFAPKRVIHPLRHHMVLQRVTRH